MFANAVPQIAAAIVAKLLPEITDADRKAWNGSSVVDWANESYQIAIQPKVRYCRMRQGACWYALNNRRHDRGEDRRKVEVDDAYLDRFAPIIRMRIKQAGVRLGHMLNEALGE